MVNAPVLTSLSNTLVTVAFASPPPSNLTKAVAPLAMVTDLAASKLATVV